MPDRFSNYKKKAARTRQPFSLIASNVISSCNSLSFQYTQSQTIPMQKVILPYLLAFVLLMVVIILSRKTFNNTQDFAKLAETSRDIIRQYSNLDVELRSAEIFSPSYENSTASELYNIYKRDLNHIEPSLKQLKYLAKDNPQQIAIADKVEKIIITHLQTLRFKNMVEIINTEGLERLQDLTTAHILIREGRQLEERLLKNKRDNLIDANNKNNLLTLVLSILAIIIVSVTFLNQFVLSKKSLWLEGFLESILNTTQNGIV